MPEIILSSPPEKKKPDVYSMFSQEVKGEMATRAIGESTAQQLLANRPLYELERDNPELIVWARSALENAEERWQTYSSIIEGPFAGFEEPSPVNPTSKVEQFIAHNFDLLKKIYANADHYKMDTEKCKLVLFPVSVFEKAAKKASKGDLSTLEGILSKFRTAYDLKTDEIASPIQSFMKGEESMGWVSFHESFTTALQLIDAPEGSGAVWDMVLISEEEDTLGRKDYVDAHDMNTLDWLAITIQETEWTSSESPLALKANSYEVGSTSFYATGSFDPYEMRFSLGVMPQHSPSLKRRRIARGY